MFDRREALRAWRRRYVIALGVALGLTTSGAVLANMVIDAKITNVRRLRLTLKPADPGQPGNFVLIGSDSRAFVDPNNKAQSDAFGRPSTETGQRSDTLMVLHVDPDARKSLLVSIPRDLWVDIPGIGGSKINAAFSSGPQKVIDTLQVVFGVPINHYAQVDFSSFEAIVDKIGRVPVYVPAKSRDSFTGFETPGPGCYQLDGTAALQYVRTRHLEYYDPVTSRWQVATAGSDLGRLARQQNFIRRIGALAYRSALGDPLKANSLADGVLGKLQVDQRLSRADMFKLVKTFRTVDPANPNSLQTVTLPVIDGGYRGGGQQVLALDQPAADQVILQLKTFSRPNAPASTRHNITPPQVTVRVLNGAGAGGVAGYTLNALQAKFGFVGGGVGNTTRISVTTLRYPPGLDAAARLVQRHLGGLGQLKQDPTLKAPEVVVVLGSDYRRVVVAAVTAPAAAGTGPTTTTTTLDPGNAAQAAAEAACAP